MLEALPGPRLRSADRGRTLNQRNLAVVVAMATVRMMQVPINQVVHMVSMRNGGVPASFSMNVPLVVTAARVRWRAGIRVCFRYLQHAFVNVAFVGVMQMAIVQIVHMVSMLDCRMTASGTMRMRMIFVSSMSVHLRYILPSGFFCLVELGPAEPANAPCTGEIGWGGTSVACAMALNSKSTTCWSARAY